MPAVALIVPPRTLNSPVNAFFMFIAFGDYISASSLIVIIPGFV